MAEFVLLDEVEKKIRARTGGMSNERKRTKTLSVIVGIIQMLNKANSEK